MCLGGESEENVAEERKAMSTDDATGDGKCQFFLKKY